MCVHGTLQARMLEWVAVSSSRGSSWITSGSQITMVTAGRVCSHVCVLKYLLC